MHLGSATRTKRCRRAVVSEINVTPLVDVMLVLLIIFMVTSPMLVSGINVDLPETDSNPIAGQDEPLVVTMNDKREVFILEIPTERTKLVEKLMNITKEKKDSRIFVRGDKNISYGEVMELMSEIHAAGFHKVALISNIKRNDQ